jgi:nitrogenase molybdenum-iron protein NifN
VAKLLRRKKALSVSPLKASATVGAALAFMGLDRAIPILHGSQGCTAFAKVFFVRHFREPIPMQTTAMDQVSAVMGADDNVIEALSTVCEKTRPQVIGLLSTGLSEVQGADIVRLVKTFQSAHPQYSRVDIVPVNTPDFTGCLETGYADALKAMIDKLVPDVKAREDLRASQTAQINVLASAMLTPGDVETVKETIEAFGMRPVVIPDLADSLDGHLDDDDFSPTTTGGVQVSAFANLHRAAATLVLGSSLDEAADLLKNRTGVRDFRFPHLLTLSAVDGLICVMRKISGRQVPAGLERQRGQLQDAMLDTHFTLGQARVAVAENPELLLAFCELLASVGAEVVAAVSPVPAETLRRVPAREVKIGDLEDLERIARSERAELLIGNSHAAASAGRLDIPLLRAGFPQYDLYGGYQRTWIGYRGIRQALFDIANLLQFQNRHDIKPYRSIYTQTLYENSPSEVDSHGIATSSARGRQQH